jgi:predicted DCC family thiol-disulfide oxidoreductase YuxK
MEATDRTNRGDAPIVVYDGVCRLCSRWVAFLLKHDTTGRIRFAAMQGVHGRALLQQHGLDPDDPTSFLWIENDRGYRNSDAILRIVAGFGGAWRLIAAVRVMPRPLRDAAYRVIARNRYRWFGRHATCLVADEAVRARFLD